MDHSNQQYIAGHFPPDWAGWGALPASQVGSGGIFAAASRLGVTGVGEWTAPTGSLTAQAADGASVQHLLSPDSRAGAAAGIPPLPRRGRGTPGARLACAALGSLLLSCLASLASEVDGCLTLAAREGRLWTGHADQIATWQIALSNGPATLLSSLPLPAAPRQLLPLDGGVLVVMGDGGALLLPHAADADSITPQWLGVPPPVRAAAERRGRLALAAAASGVWLYTTGPSEPPALRGVFAGAGDARAVGFVASLLCVADGTNGLKFLDISDPAQPELIGLYAPPDAPPASLLAISTTLIAVADGRQVRLLDASDPRLPFVNATRELPATARAMILAMPRLWVACGEAGLIELDAVHALGELRRHPTLGPALAVATDGPRVFVAEGPAGWREVSPTPR